MCGLRYHRADPRVLREKVPNVLSRCNTKRRTGATTSFGMTPTFWIFFFLKKKKWKILNFFIGWKSFFFQKKRKSKGRHGHVRPSFFLYDNNSGQ